MVFIIPNQVFCQDFDWQAQLQINIENDAELIVARIASDIEISKDDYNFFLYMPFQIDENLSDSQLEALEPTLTDMRIGFKNKSIKVGHVYPHGFLRLENGTSPSTIWGYGLSGATRMQQAFKPVTSDLQDAWWGAEVQFALTNKTSLHTFASVDPSGLGKDWTLAGMMLQNIETIIKDSDHFAELSWTSGALQGRYLDQQDMILKSDDSWFSDGSLWNPNGGFKIFTSPSIAAQWQDKKTKSKTNFVTLANLQVNLSWPLEPAFDTTLAISLTRTWLDEKQYSLLLENYLQLSFHDDHWRDWYGKDTGESFKSFFNSYLRIPNHNSFKFLAGFNLPSLASQLDDYSKRTWRLGLGFKHDTLLKFSLDFLLQEANKWSVSNALSYQFVLSEKHSNYTLGIETKIDYVQLKSQLLAIFNLKENTFFAELELSSAWQRLFIDYELEPKIGIEFAKLKLDNKSYLDLAFDARLELIIVDGVLESQIDLSTISLEFSASIKSEN